MADLYPGDPTWLVFPIAANENWALSASQPNNMHMCYNTRPVRASALAATAYSILVQRVVTDDGRGEWSDRQDCGSARRRAATNVAAAS